MKGTAHRASRLVLVTPFHFSPLLLSLDSGKSRTRVVDRREIEEGRKEAVIKALRTNGQLRHTHLEETPECFAAIQQGMLLQPHAIHPQQLKSLFVTTVRTES
jgi:hypothetical protein